MRRRPRTVSHVRKAARTLAAVCSTAVWFGFFSAAFTGERWHTGTWTWKKVCLQGNELDERSLNLEPDPCSRPSMLRVLKHVLSSEEVALILDALSTERLSATDALNNPVKSASVVLAEDGYWKRGSLAKLVKGLVEDRLLPYMRSVLACPSLQVAQVLIRRYAKDGCRSFKAHVDHLSFGTAVADLTPVPGSGLYVCSQGGHSGRVDANDAFFIPFESGDVAVHGWEVWHGLKLKQGHERVSLIVWTRPARDVPAGTCSWYWNHTDCRAGYHMGIEAWRHRLLGQTKAALLRAALQESDLRHLREKLRALGGARQAEMWFLKCTAAASRERLRDSKLTKQLYRLADAQAAGSVLQSWRPNITLGPDARRMRKAFQQGWEDAQEDLPDFSERSQDSEVDDLDTTAGGMLADLTASMHDADHAAHLLRHAGLVVFDKQDDALDRDLLCTWLADFRKYFALIQHELGCQGIEAQKPFVFNEVCSRLSERYDVRFVQGKGQYSLETMPWKQLIYDVLGVSSKDLQGCHVTA